MSLITRLRRRLETEPERDPSEVVVRECRHCGTTLQTGADECPACESEQIATYVIS